MNRALAAIALGVATLLLGACGGGGGGGSTSTGGGVTGVTPPVVVVTPTPTPVVTPTPPPPASSAVAYMTPGTAGNSSSVISGASKNASFVAISQDEISGSSLPTATLSVSVSGSSTSSAQRTPQSIAPQLLRAPASYGGHEYPAEAFPAFGRDGERMWKASVHAAPAGAQSAMRKTQSLPQQPLVPKLISGPPWSASDHRQRLRLFRFHPRWLPLLRTVASLSITA